jgi:predicted ArsR family transcriptional regulator
MLNVDLRRFFRQELLLLEGAMDLASHAAGIGALADPSRRALYEYVVGSARPVTRDEAAAAVGLAVSTAGFHLDKLVGEGLLDTEFRRLSGRSGPGAGRPSKLYRRGAREFAVSLPARRYDLVGEILAAAFDRAAAGEDLSRALDGCAGAEGRSLGDEARVGGTRGDVDGLATVLTTQGYEPRLAEAGCLELGNCPFDALAQRHTELVCGLNVHFVQGVADGLGADAAEARLDPADGRCCVTVRARTT